MNRGFLRPLIFAAFAVWLAGCDIAQDRVTNQPGGAYTELAYDEASPAPPPPPPAPSLSAADRAQYGASGEGGQEPIVLLAYRYSMGLELAAESLAAVHQGHVEACRSARAQSCQVISASVNDPEGPRPSAQLELRAAPDWIAQFRAGLPSETQAAGGRILSDYTSVEDLTAQIVDAQARLEARTTLRDRLQTLLETREGDLGELLQVERELARVQEQLDAQASVVAALRQRVATSTLAVSYQARRDLVEPDQFNPIMSALRDVGDVFSESVGALILIAAALAPWLLIGLPLLWLAVRWIRGVFRRRAAKAAER